MKKRFLSSLFVLVLSMSVLFLASCKNTTSPKQTDTHVHEFESIYSFNDEYHFKRAICGHDVVSEEAPHEFDGDVCKICSYMKERLDPLSYELSNDGQYYTVVHARLFNLTDLNIVVPGTYKGLPVLKIGEHAFKAQDVEKIDSITISEGVEEIEDFAFYGVKVDKVVIPESMKYIGKYAFANSGLKELVMENHVRSVGENAFFNVSNSLSATICASNLKYMPKDKLNYVTFTQDEVIEENTITDEFIKLYFVTFKGNVKTISKNAINGSHSVRLIRLYESVTSVDKDAFTDCYGLREILDLSPVTLDSKYNELIEIDPQRVNVVLDDGFVLYSEGHLHREILGSYMDSYVIEVPAIEPENYYIDSYAFYKRNDIAIVKIPKSIDIIFSKAFVDCNNLYELVIYPLTMANSNRDAFVNCSYLRDVFTPEVPEEQYIDSCGTFVNRISANTKLSIGTSTKDVDIREEYVFFENDLIKYTGFGKNIVLGDPYIKAGAFDHLTMVETFETGNATSARLKFLVKEAKVSIAVYNQLNKAELKRVSLCGEGSIEFDNDAFNLEYLEIGTHNASVDMFQNPLKNMIHVKEFYGHGDDVLTCLPSNSLEKITIVGSQYVITNKTYPKLKYLVVDYVNEYSKEVFSGNVLEYAEGPMELFEHLEARATLKEAVVITGGMIIPRLFSNYTQVEKITFNHEIESIHEEAFYNCRNLREINLTKTLNFIFDNAFYGCDSLGLKTENNIVYLKIEDNDYFAIVDVVDKNVNTLVINENAKVASYDLFKALDLVSVTSPLSTLAEVRQSKIKELTVKSVDDENADIFFDFGEHLYLQKLIIDKNVTLKDGIFNNLQNLKEVVANIDSLDHIILDKVTKLTINVGKSKNGVVNLRGRHLSALRELVLEEGVTEIGEYSFNTCSTLYRVVLPSTLKKINDFAFEFAFKVTEIINKSNLNITKGSHDFGNIAQCAISITKEEKSNIKMVDEFVVYEDDTKFYILDYTGDDEEITLPISSKEYVVTDYVFNGYLRNLTVLSDVTFNNNAFINTYENIFQKATVPVKNYEYFMTYASLTDLTLTGNGTIDYTYTNTTLKKLTILGEVNIPSNLYLYNLEELTAPYNAVERIIHSDYGDKLTSLTLNEQSSLYTFDIPMSGCNKLKTIIFNDGLEVLAIGALQGINHLESVSLPSTLRTIKEHAFRNCSSLETLYIPTTVVSIEEGILSGCESLTTLTIPYIGSSLNNTLYTSYDSVFGYIFGGTSYSNSYKITQSYESMYSSNFGYFFIPNSLKNITILGGNVLRYTLEGLNSLESIVLSENVGVIEKQAFDSVPKAVFTEYKDLYYLGLDDNPYYYLIMPKRNDITRAVLHEDINVISSDAFKQSIKLLEVVNMSNIEITKGSNDNGYVGRYALSIVSSEEESNLKVVDDYIFIKDNDTYLLTNYIGTSLNLTLPLDVEGEGYAIKSFDIANKGNIKSLVVPESVKFISEGAFKGFGSLESITLPFTGYNNTTFQSFGHIFGQEPYYGGVATVQNYNQWDSFTYYIPGYLTTVTLTSANYNYLKNYVFHNCTNLYTVNVPSDLLSVGRYAFLGCYSLRYNTYKYHGYLGNSENPYVVLMDVDKEKHDFTIHENTKALREYVFENTVNLTSITISGSIKRIPDCAFYQCANLKEVVLSEGVSEIQNFAFGSCSSLSTIEIPSSIISIGDQTFSNCNENLIKLYKGEGVDDPDRSTFYNIESVARTSDYVAALRKDKTAIILEYLDNSSDITLPSMIGEHKVTSLNKRLFEDRDTLTSVTLPEYLERIEKYVFSGCINLASIEFPSTLKYIGNVAFSDCTSLKGVFLKEGVESIAQYAFDGCTNLGAVGLPSTLTSVGYHAIGGKTSLKIFINMSSVPSTWTQNWCAQGVIAFNTSVSFIDEAGFLYSEGEDNALIIVGYIGPNADVVIPSISGKTVSIGESAFENNKAFRSIVFPNNYKGDVGKYAFRGCTNLVSVVFTNGVGYIRDMSFEGCTKLSSITFPNSIDSKYQIGKSAFAKCTALTSIDITEGCIGIHPSGFEGCSNLVTVVVSSTKFTTILEFGFFDCEKLTTITLPGSMTKTNRSIFGACPALTTIYFNGTSETWTNIKTELGRKLYNNTTGNYVIVCTDATLDRDNNIIS